MLEQQYKTRQDARREHDFRYDIKNSLNTRERRRGAVAEVYEWVESCVIAVGVILLIFAFAARTATVSGPSMLPTLRDGDRLLLVQAGYHDPDHQAGDRPRGGRDRHRL